ncbi:MAG: hypothetical protein AAF609_06790 [Cyanobacteria bacterium P01_C01_bin.120]
MLARGSDWMMAVQYAAVLYLTAAELSRCVTGQHLSDCQISSGFVGEVVSGEVVLRLLRISDQALDFAMMLRKVIE